MPKGQRAKNKTEDKKTKKGNGAKASGSPIPVEVHHCDCGDHDHDHDEEFDDLDSDSDPDVDPEGPIPGLVWTEEELTKELAGEEIRWIAPYLRREAEPLWEFYEKSTTLNDLHRWLISMRFVELEDDESALKVFQDIVDSRLRHPGLDYPYIFEQYIHALLRPAGRYAEAMEYQRRLMAEFPDDDLMDQWRMDEAVLAIESGEVEEGRQLFRRLMEEYPEDPSATLELAGALLAAGYLDEAESVLIDAEKRETFEWDPDDEGVEPLLEAIEEAREFLQDPSKETTDYDSAWYALRSGIRPIRESGVAGPRTRDEMVRLYELYEAANRLFPDSDEIKECYREISEMDEELELNAVEVYLARRSQAPKVKKVPRDKKGPKPKKHR